MDIGKDIKCLERFSMKRQKSLPASVSAPILLVQVIRTEWTKLSRGGQGAVLRHKVPMVMPLPALERRVDISSYVIQHIDFYERNIFVAPYAEHTELKPKTEQTHYFTQRTRPHGLSIAAPHSYMVAEIFGEETIRYDRVNISWEDFDVKIVYRYLDGAPFRDGSPAMLPFEMTLMLGAWIQLTYNARYGVDAGWVYDKWVFNIGLFVQPASDIFLISTPMKTFARLSTLW